MPNSQQKEASSEQIMLENDSNQDLDTTQTIHRYLGPHAFDKPELIKQERNYTLIYGDTPVISIANPSELITDNEAEISKEFNEQFKILIEKFTSLVIDLTSDTALIFKQDPGILINNLSGFQNKLFDKSYSGIQPVAFFENFKYTLEGILLLFLDEKNNFSAEKKQYVIKALPEIIQLSICAPGAFSRIEALYNDLTGQNTLKHWLMDLRYNLVMKRKDRYNSDENVRPGLQVHIYTALTIYAQQLGWNLPSAFATDAIDNFVKSAGFTEIHLLDFHAWFLENYTPEQIVSYLAELLNDKLSDLEKDLKEKNSNYNEYSEKVTALLKQLDIELSEVAIFPEVDDDYDYESTTLVIDKKSLKILLLDKLIQKKIFNEELQSEIFTIELTEGDTLVFYPPYPNLSYVTGNDKRQLTWDEYLNELKVKPLLPEVLGEVIDEKHTSLIANLLTGANLSESDKSKCVAYLDQAINSTDELFNLLLQLSVQQRATLITEVSWLNSKNFIKFISDWSAFAKLLDIVEDIGDMKPKQDIIYDLLKPKHVQQYFKAIPKQDQHFEYSPFIWTLSRTEEGAQRTYLKSLVLRYISDIVINMSTLAMVLRCTSADDFFDIIIKQVGKEKLLSIIKTADDFKDLIEQFPLLKLSRLDSFSNFLNFLGCNFIKEIIAEDVNKYRAIVSKFASVNTVNVFNMFLGQDYLNKLKDTQINIPNIEAQQPEARADEVVRRILNRNPLARGEPYPLVPIMVYQPRLVEHNDAQEPANIRPNTSVDPELQKAWWEFCAINNVTPESFESFNRDFFIGNMKEKYLAALKQFMQQNPGIKPTLSITNKFIITNASPHYDFLVWQAWSHSFALHNPKVTNILDTWRHFILRADEKTKIQLKRVIQLYIQKNPDLHFSLSKWCEFIGYPYQLPATKSKKSAAKLDAEFLPVPTIDPDLKQAWNRFIIQTPLNHSIFEDSHNAILDLKLDPLTYYRLIVQEKLFQFIQEYPKLKSKIEDLWDQYQRFAYNIMDLEFLNQFIQANDKTIPNLIQSNAVPDITPLSLFESSFDDLTKVADKVKKMLDSSDSIAFDALFSQIIEIISTYIDVNIDNNKNIFSSLISIQVVKIFEALPIDFKEKFRELENINTLFTVLKNKQDEIQLLSCFINHIITSDKYHGARRSKPKLFPNSLKQLQDMLRSQVEQQVGMASHQSAIYFQLIKDNRISKEQLFFKFSKENSSEVIALSIIGNFNTDQLKLIFYSPQAIGYALKFIKVSEASFFIDYLLEKGVFWQAFRNYCSAQSGSDTAQPIKVLINDILKAVMLDHGKLAKKQILLILENILKYTDISSITQEDKANLALLFSNQEAISIFEEYLTEMKVQKKISNDHIVFIKRQTKDITKATNADNKSSPMEGVASTIARNNSHQVASASDSSSNEGTSNKGKGKKRQYSNNFFDESARKKSKTQGSQSREPDDDYPTYGQKSSRP